MVEKNSYKEAVNLYSCGQLSKCRETLEADYDKLIDPNLKINYLLMLIVLIDPVFDIDYKISICAEGITLSKAVKNVDALPYFQAMTAYCYITKATEYLSIKKDITIAPNRINFSLESDRDLYTSVSESFAMLRQEAESLIDDSKNSDQSNTELQAHLHSLYGHVYSAQASIFLMEYYKFSWLHHLLRLLRLNYFIFTSRNERRNLKNLINKAKNEFELSAELHERIQDYVGVAMALMNISNHYRTFFQFRKAKKYLNKSKNYSNLSNLQDKRNALEKSIVDKNTNVPDYKSKLPRPVLRRDMVKNMKKKLMDWFN